MRRLAHLKQRGRARIPAADCSSRNRATTCSAARFETPDEVRLLVDAGPLGYLSIAAHGHADALAFVLDIGDREILVDPGTYAYHTDPGVAALLPQHAGAQHRGHRRRRTSRMQAGNFMWTRSRAGALHRVRGRHGTPALRRRALRLPAARGSGGASARDRLRRGRQLDRSDRPCCAVRANIGARRAWHFAEDCQVERVGDGFKVTSGHHPGVLRAARGTRAASRSIAAAAPSRAAGFRAASAASSRAPRCCGIRACAGVTVLRTRITYTRSRRRWPLNPPSPERRRTRSSRPTCRAATSTLDAASTTIASALFNEIGDIDAEARTEAGLYRAGVRHLSRLTLTINCVAAVAARRDAARRQRAADRESHQPGRARRRRARRRCRAARCTSRARASSGTACATR